MELQSYFYLASILFSILGIGLLDFRHKLAIATKPVAALVAISVGVAVFIGWDLIGIALGIFFRGQTPFLTGIMLAPELPFEELFFLILLCYTTLVMYLGIARRFAK